MIVPGLVSITFRKLTPREIVDLVGQAKLDAIEWGGDIHVPHGAIVCANEVSRMTREAGLVVAAYGSYYRVGTGQEFEPVLATGRELGAPTIRVWAGNADTPWAAVVEDSRRIADMADRAGIPALQSWVWLHHSVAFVKRLGLRGKEPTAGVGLWRTRGVGCR